MAFFYRRGAESAEIFLWFIVLCGNIFISAVQITNYLPCV